MEDTTGVSDIENSPGKGFEAKVADNKPEWKIRLHVDSRIVELREDSIDILVDVMSNWMRKQASGNPNNVSIKMTTCFTKDIPIDYSAAELQTLLNAELHDFPTKYSSYEKSMDIYLTSNKPGEHHANNSRPGCDEQHNKRTAEDFVREFSNRMYQMWLAADNVDIYAVDMLQYHLSTMFPEYTDIIERIMNTKRNTSVNRVRKKMKTSGSTTPPSSDMYSAQIIESTAKILYTMISQFDLWCQKNKNNTYTKTAHDILCSHEFKHLFNEFKTIFLLDM